MFLPMLLHSPFTGKRDVDQLFNKKYFIGVKQGTLQLLKKNFYDFQKNLERIESREEFFKKNPRLLVGPLYEKTLRRMIPFAPISQSVFGLPLPCYPSHIVFYYNRLRERGKLGVLGDTDDTIIQTIKEVVGESDENRFFNDLNEVGPIKACVIPYLRALKGGDLNALERKILKVSSDYFLNCFRNSQAAVQKEKKEFQNEDHS